MIIDIPKAPAFKVNWQAPEFSSSDAAFCSICWTVLCAAPLFLLLLYLLDFGGRHFV